MKFNCELLELSLCNINIHNTCGLHLQSRRIINYIKLNSFHTLQVTTACTAAVNAYVTLLYTHPSFTHMSALSIRRIYVHFTRCYIHRFAHPLITHSPWVLLALVPAQSRMPQFKQWRILADS